MAERFQNKVNCNQKAVTVNFSSSSRFFPPGKDFGRKFAQHREPYSSQLWPLRSSAHPRVLLHIVFYMQPLLSCSPYSHRPPLLASSVSIDGAHASKFAW